MSTSRLIAISGASGFIGRYLSAYLKEAGYRIMPLSRDDFAKGPEVLSGRLAGAGVVVHLAGAPISRRWTKSVMREIESSRIDTTRTLVMAINQMIQPPELFISASAVGIYPSTGQHDETSGARAGDFLGHVCQAWEGVAQAVTPATRLVNIRIGLVLGRDGGLFMKLSPLFRAGLGGRIGTGHQGFPFIHVSDFAGAIRFIIESPEISGPVNMVAPVLTDNRSFTKELARQLKRPAWLPVPVTALRLLFGKGADVFAAGQQVIPAKLIGADYMFQFSDIRSAISDLLKP
jgi:hypothetical protein